MLQLLAEASGPTGEDIKTWLLVVSVLANGVAGLRIIMGRAEKREITNDPINVRKHHEYVTLEEHEKLNRESAASLDRLESGFKEATKGITAHISTLVHELRDEHRKDVEDLHDRISGVEGRVNHHAERIASVETRQGVCRTTKQ